MKNRSKKFYFFSTVALIIVIWVLVVMFDKSPVASLHGDGSALGLSRVADMPSVSCEDKTISVKLVADSNTKYDLVGELCYFGSLDNKTLQVMVSGSGYGSAYWDFPYKADTYSYMRAALRAGDAVFNFDRLGMGRSAHPFGATLDVDAQAYVLHQVVVELTNEQSYNAVVTLGHSFGSVISLSYALSYPEELDGIVLTGYAHNVNPDFGPSMGKGIAIAAFSEPFMGDIFDPAYVVTKPNSRGDVFYTSENTERAVITTDDLTRQTTAVGELMSMSKYFGEQSKSLQVPVLMIVGEDDFLVCGGQLDCSNYDAVLANEAPYFPAESCLELVLLDDTNHNANLHRNAPKTFETMIGWVARRVGSAGSLPVEPCTN